MNTLAVAQTVSRGTLEDNLKEVQYFIEQAASKKAQIVIFPEECLTQSFIEAEKGQCQERLGDGPIQDKISAFAKANNIWVLVGSFPISSEEKERYYSTALLFNHQGECVEHYHKIYMFDAIVEKEQESYQESKHVKPGNEIKVVETPVGKMGLSICYDMRFPEIFRRQVQMGAQIICVTASFTYRTGMAHWDVLTRARAIENLCYLAASGNCGDRPNGQRTWGHSRIINPWGQNMQEAEFEPALLIQDIDLKAQETIRAQFPVLTHMREDLKDDL